jgi:hypothetical protein
MHNVAIPRTPGNTLRGHAAGWFETDTQLASTNQKQISQTKRAGRSVVPLRDFAFVTDGGEERVVFEV